VPITIVLKSSIQLDKKGNNNGLQSGRAEVPVVEGLAEIIKKANSE